MAASGFVVCPEKVGGWGQGQVNLRASRRAGRACCVAAPNARRKRTRDRRSLLCPLTCRGRSLASAYLLAPTATSEPAQMHSGMLCRRCRHARRAANRLCGSAGASACHYDSGHAAGDVREARSYWFHWAESIGGSAIYNGACFWSRPGGRYAARIPSSAGFRRYNLMAGRRHSRKYSNVNGLRF